MALAAAFCWQWALVGDAPTAEIEAGATSPAAPGLGLVYEPAALYPANYPSWPEPLIYDEQRQTATLVAPTPSVVEAATARVSSQGGQLTRDEAEAVLRAAGWPTDLIPQALAVSYCESKWSPYALGDSGRSAGLFQVNRATWFPYAGEDPEQWADPLVNARVAWATYQYDLGRGYESWRQWSCKP